MIPQTLPFLAGFTLSASLIMAIGAQNLFVLRQGLRREHVAPIVLFCSSADALLILAGVSGAGVLLASVPELRTVASLGGAAFLLWYGISALRRMASSQVMHATGGASVTLGRAMASTAAFTFLNPHVYLDTVLLMGLTGAAQPAPMRPWFVAGAASFSLCWFITLGFGARLLRPIFERATAWRVLDALVGVMMLLLASSLFRDAFHV